MFVTWSQTSGNPALGSGFLNARKASAQPKRTERYGVAVDHMISAPNCYTRASPSPSGSRAQFRGKPCDGIHAPVQGMLETGPE